MICPICGYCEKPRSIQQNKAHFGIAVTMLAKQCNTNKEAMHKALAGEFLGFDEVKMPNNKTVLVPKSTKTLTTKQFKDFMEKIQQWASENGYDIPSPNEKPYHLNEADYATSNQ